MGVIGQRIAEFRTLHQLSQADLAEKIGVSQATISRTEKADDDPADIRFLIKIADALRISLLELTEGSDVHQTLTHSHDDTFKAFCPNPLCDSNESGVREDGSAWVSWRSSRNYAGHLYNDVNFCGKCGTSLVKACPNCGLRMDAKGQSFCTRCGKELSSRPNEDDWKKIRKRHPGSNKLPAYEPIGEDDIPF